MLIRRTIGIRLYEDEIAALRTIAEREDRDVKRQAARLIRESLIRMEALSDQNDPVGTPDPKPAA